MMQQRAQFDRQNNHMQYNNYMPQQGVCRDFKDNKCRKQGCRFEHKYELCPDFDKGFCFKGLECPKKHVIRKLCFDYLYGFCKDGPDCKMVHVKLFNKYERNDLKFTEQFYKLLKETGPYAYHIDPGDFPDFKPVICNACSEIGHKSNVCKRETRQTSRVSPTKMILCGVCGEEHQIQLQGKLEKCQISYIQHMAKEEEESF